jgi:prepilin-type N-terminal cleavage/methylation domain-containing protein
MKSRPAFTLIELIIVIVIIAVIASVIFFAVNPSKRIGDAQNAIREHEALELKQGIERFIADNVVIPNTLTQLVVGTEYMLVTPNGETAGTCNCSSLNANISRIDLAGLLSAYVPNLPVDPEAIGDDTGYYIKHTSGNLFSVGYCNEYSDNAVISESPATFCGDASCNGSETCLTCSTDCGICPASPTVSDAGRFPANGQQVSLGVITPTTPLSWSAWTDPNGDTVEYYTTIWTQSGACEAGNVLESSAWSTATTYNIVGPIYTSWIYSWKTKGRSQGLSDDSAFNTCYSWTNSNPKSSCPFLYLWDGDKYEYLTDIKGQNIGFPSTHSRSKKTDYYIPNQVPLNGFLAENGIYKLKFRESLKEMNYFDELKLILVDHPEGYDIISSTADDRLTFEYKEQQNILYSIKDPRLPISAIDQDGYDVLAQVSAIDNILAQDYSNDKSFVELDFGQLNPEHSKLVIDGWSIYQLAREKREQVMPYVEVLDENNMWIKANDFGFISGDMKTIVVDLANKFLTNDYRVRIHFGYNQVSATLLDRIRLDDSEPIDFEIKSVALTQADLYHAGFDSYEYANEDHRVENVQDVNGEDVKQFYFYGDFTKYGDVKELLDQVDDQFVIFRHGDALDVSFPDLDKPQAGYERTPILYADIFYKIFYEDKSGKYGLAKDPMSIYPLPFKGMSQYPYDTAIENYPSDSLHNEYLNKWNTRVCEEGEDYCYDSETGYRILTSQQKEELDIASTRILNGPAGTTSSIDSHARDVANIEYATKYYGYFYSGNQ